MENDSIVQLYSLRLVICHNHAGMEQVMANERAGQCHTGIMTIVPFVLVF
jgi:hypothetical protein